MKDGEGDRLAVICSGSAARAPRFQRSRHDAAAALRSTRGRRADIPLARGGAAPRHTGAARRLGPGASEGRTGVAGPR
eukprot:scaffold898_cov92-Isochrysis_galbana.AAC.2